MISDARIAAFADRMCANDQPVEYAWNTLWHMMGVAPPKVGTIIKIKLPKAADLHQRLTKEEADPFYLNKEMRQALFPPIGSTLRIRVPNKFTVRNSPDAPA